MAIQINNLNAALGAEVSGIDVSKPVPPAEIDAIESAWRERLVVVFHGQSLSDAELIAFSKNFGALDPPGPNPYGAPFITEYPELNVISNVVENGKPIGNLGDGEAVWHADMTYVEVPPKAALTACAGGSAARGRGQHLLRQHVQRIRDTAGGAEEGCRRQDRRARRIAQ